MNNDNSLEEIINRIKKERIPLIEIKKIIEKIKTKINSDFELVFSASKNIDVFHNLLKEIGYNSSIIQFSLEGMFNYNDSLKEIIPHLQNISQIYTNLKIDFRI